MDPIVYGYFNLRPSSHPKSDKKSILPDSDMKTGDQTLKNGIAENSYYGTFQPE